MLIPVEFKAKAMVKGKAERIGSYLREAEKMTRLDPTLRPDRGPASRWSRL